MDSLETISNCSESSDGGSSRLSTLSGLSTYKDEFLELRHLVNPEKHPQFANINASQGNIGRHEKGTLQLEERCKSLTDQLNLALNLNRELKSESYNVEKRTELRFNEQIEKLVRHNNQLQLNLESANVQINRLISNYTLKNENSQISQLQTKILTLEKSTHQCNLRNSSLDNEIFHSKRARSELESENDQIKLELNDLRLEFSAKNNCINELKNKVSEQHVQLQDGLRANLKLSNSIGALTNELDRAEKSETWYKERLHQCQSERKSLVDEVVALKKSLAARDDAIEGYKVEASKWRCRCEEKELEWLQEKKTILETHSEKEARSKCERGSCENDVEPESVNQSSLINYYESTVNDLRAEIDRIKTNIEEQSLNVEASNKDNAILITKCTNLQRELEIREYNFQLLDNDRKELEMKLKLLGDKDKEILVLKNTISDLRIDVSSKNRENESIIDSVRGIKEQFKSFKSNYENLKSELVRKGKEILKLQEEKQTLFMSNNWKTCELEKSKERDSEVQKLQQELLNSVQNENKWKFEASKFKSELERLKIHFDEQIKSAEIETGNEVNRLKSLLSEKEKSFDNLKDDISILKNEIRDRDGKIRNLSGKNLDDFEDFVKKMCQILNYDSGNWNNGITKSSKIQDFLNFFKSQITSKDSSISNLKFSLDKLKNEVANRLEILEKRNSDLGRKCEENLDLLLDLGESKFEDNTPDEIKHLQALLQVKIREQKEKQKKYETNYRTLLRKVKEHMKHRNSAEKHNVYLQELYNTLSDENNSLKLQLGSKEYELKTLENFVEEHRKTNERQKRAISSLEDQLNALNNCEKCAEFDLIVIKIKNLEDLKRENEQMIDWYRNQAEEKDAEISSLKLEGEQLHLDACRYKRDLENSVQRIENLSQTNEELQNQVDQLEKRLDAEKSDNSEKLLGEKEINSKLLSENQSLSNLSSECADKNAYLLNELEILKSEFKSKSEELVELQRRNCQLQSDQSKKESEERNAVASLKSQLVAFKNETESTKTEKYFLQRLCNDLKVALKVHVSRNELLREQLSTLMRKEKQEFSSLPSSLLADLPAHVSFDDDYIDRLLQESRAPLKEKPLSDVQVCLDALKREVSVLQRQVEKSAFGNNR